MRMCEQAMGIERFDVDMYSCDAAQKVVQARYYFTKQSQFRFSPGLCRPGFVALCNPPASLYAEAWHNMADSYERWCWIGFNWDHTHKLARLYPDEHPLKFFTVLLPSRIRFNPGPGLKESSPSKESYVTFASLAPAEAFCDLYYRKFGKRCVVL